jgi:hypothetical protein
MAVEKSFAEFNERIKEGQAVVVTAVEFIDLVARLPVKLEARGYGTVDLSRALGLVGRGKGAVVLVPLSGQRGNYER